MGRSKQLYIVGKIILFILFVYLAFMAISYRPSDFDEIWIFGSSHKINNGLIPYKDFNIVSFPLFYYFMSLFASKLYIYRIAESVLDVLLLYICCYVVEKHSKNKINLFLIFLLVVGKTCLVPFVTYNEFMSIIVLLSFLSLKKYLDTNNSLNIFLTGFLLSLALITKQSVPAIIIIGITPVLIFHFIKNKKYKDFGLYAVGGILPVLTLVIVAIYNNYLFEMIDLTFMGLKDFNVTTDDSTFYYLFLFIFVLVLLSIIIKIIKNKKMEIFDFSVIIYVVSFFIIAKPLKDTLHALIAIIFIFTIFSVYSSNQKIVQIILFNLCFAASVLSMMSAFNTFTNDKIINNDWDLFENISFEPDFIEFVNRKIDYIEEYREKGYEIKDCSFDAIFTSLALEENGGYCDMMLRGNLGSKQKELFLKKFENLDIVLYWDISSKWDIPEILDSFENDFVLVEKSNGYPFVLDIYVNKNIVDNFNKEGVGIF